MSTARPGFPRFGGPFKSFSVSVSTNREKGTDSRLLVYSQGSRAKVSEYLWLKYLWDELSKKEMELFLGLTETLNSQIRIAALRAVLLVGKRLVRERLVNFPFLNEKELPTRARYLGYKRLDVEIYDLTRNLPKVPKFSGWVRSSSSVGSKRKSRGPSFLEPLAIFENDYEDEMFDWYNYLTVGDQSLYPQWVEKVTPMRP